MSSLMFTRIPVQASGYLVLGCLAAALGCSNVAGTDTSSNSSSNSTATAGPNTTVTGFHADILPTEALVSAEDVSPVLNTIASEDVATAAEGRDKLNIPHFLHPELHQIEGDSEYDPFEAEDSEAESEETMRPYTELIEHINVGVEMVPIAGGEFTMGSPEDEAERGEGEGPQTQVHIDPFWMGKFEITWDTFEVWMLDLDIQRRDIAQLVPHTRDLVADEWQLSQPTEPYTDMTFGMGRSGYPAICMTQLAAKTYCQWLSAKTGRYYRLPTEAEWEYACRAGTTTAYSFGEEEEDIEDYGWYLENSDESYHPVGKKEPNAWGLYDMHGNVAEWVLDQYVSDFYGGEDAGVVGNPLAIPTTLYPRVVRGGSWLDYPDYCRSAARVTSTDEWKKQDPQFPQSIWYHTDALHVGFRIVRPLQVPTNEEIAEKWEAGEPDIDRHAGR